MTDFLADLEAELLRAARRRARHRRLAGLPVRGVAALAALALAGVVAVVVASALGPSGGTAPRLPGDSAGFALPGLVPPAACAASRGDAEAVPPEVRAALGVLRRPFESADDPAFLEPGGLRVPAATAYRVDVRRAGRDRLAADLRIFPTRALDPVACPSAMSAGARGPGACLVAGASTRRRAVRCFTLAEIRAGRAVGVAPPATAVGLVADGVATVRLEAGGARVDAVVVENAFAVRVPGLRAGRVVRVTPVAGAPVVGAEARILVLDGSGVPGLALEIRRRLRRVNYPHVRAARPGTAASPLPESAIAYGPGAEGTAERIGTFLGVPRVEPGRLPRGTDVAVTVGADLRRMR